MFQWDKSINTLNLPVDRVMHLYRSMRDVQMALPGFRAQEASAYLCQYQVPQGVGTAVVFHLQKSSQLAFYQEAQSIVPAGKADSMLDRALVFVESMGFLMTDLDIQLLSDSDRELLWTSLPLQKGVEPCEMPAAEAGPAPHPAAAKPAKPKFAVAMEDTSFYSEDSEFLRGNAADFPAFATAQQSPGGMPEASQNAEGSVDDLLAAVEALRNRRPGVRARRKAPSPEELNRRRQELRETIGRILASQ